MVNGERENRMEEQEARGNEHDQVAKKHLIMLMQAGYSWQKAAAMVGLQISRSTVYRLLQAVQTQGDAAILDGRHGHPAKLREAMLQWLVAICRANPRQGEQPSLFCEPINMGSLRFSPSQFL